MAVALGEEQAAVAGMKGVGAGAEEQLLVPEAERKMEVRVVAEKVVVLVAAAEEACEEEDVVGAMVA